MKKGKKTRLKENSLKTDKYLKEKTNRDDKKMDFFHEILILIVSLLHGSLFFILADQLIDLINSFSFLELSSLIFCFALFFRIFQTHLLAAIKYTEKWSLKPLDFVMVFITALFEYLLFSSEDIQSNGKDVYYHIIFIFCIFGIIGYFVTYKRTYKNYKKSGKKNELKIQAINIFCILFIGLLSIIGYVIYPIYPIITTVMNLFSAFMLFININLSIRLSKKQLNDILKID